MLSTSVFSHRLHFQEQDEGLRLDKAVIKHLPHLSRTRVQSLIQNGNISLDNKRTCSVSQKVKPGQTLEISIPESVDAKPEAQAIPLNICYEDEDVIVINKPAGLVVHPAPGNLDGTLVNALLAHCGTSLSGINGVKRPGIVHRLDKETSGLMVVAKNDTAHHNLSHQLSTREMGRVYHALVWGRLLPKECIIEGPIGRDVRNRKRMAIRTNGKEARTHVKVLRYFEAVATLVECRLETGRTHQIRVHLQSKGHPLMGDSLYGKTPKGISEKLKTYLNEEWTVGRQALHAKELRFNHPRTQEKMVFTSELPEDMRELINVLC